MVSVCFVCLGNICRSPTAEGVFRHLVREASLESDITIDSAGTGAYHAGEPPDRRATAAAKKRGIELSGRARQFVKKDFERFDYVLAMDSSNHSDLLDIAPDEYQSRLYMFRSFDPGSEPTDGVPDPYYGGGDGFERVLDIVDAGCRGLLAHIRKEHGLK